jgi:hypothetical protein
MSHCSAKFYISFQQPHFFKQIVCTRVSEQRNYVRLNVLLVVHCRFALRCTSIRYQFGQVLAVTISVLEVKWKNVWETKMERVMKVGEVETVTNLTVTIRKTNRRR